MLRPSKRLLIGLSLAAVLAVSVFLLIPQDQALAQAGGAAQRIAGKPNLNGVWQTMNTAYWDLEDHGSRPLVGQPGVTANSTVAAAPVVTLGSMGWVPSGKGVVEGGKIPYLDWAAKRKQENQANWIDRDPELKCFQPGIPRAIYMPHPFQIVQSDKKIMMVFQFGNVQRTIHLNEMEPYPNVAYMGYAVGRWDGDSLMVNVSDFTDATWFDRAGNFHSDALRVTERYTPQGPNVIQYEATMEDPQVFSRAWKISMPIYKHLEDNAQLTDFRCVEMVEETMYGHLRAKPLVTHWEGRTMSIDIKHKIPPGEEVYQRYVSGNPPE